MGIFGWGNIEVSEAMPYVCGTRQQQVGPTWAYVGGVKGSIRNNTPCGRRNTKVSEATHHVCGQGIE